MEELLEMMKKMQKEISVLKAGKAKKVRDKTSQNPKKSAPRSWYRGWRRDNKNVPELVIPKNAEEFDKMFGASQIYGILFLNGTNNDQPEFRPTPNEHSYKNIRLIIDFLMTFEENHNFWINSRRCYIHKNNGVWSGCDEISRKLFFEQIKDKIWKKYRYIVLESLELARVPKDLLNYASNHMKNNTLCWTNQYLETFLNKFKERLAIKWNARVTRK